MPTETALTKPNYNNTLTVKITARETEVLKLIVEGKTNKLIAAALNISPFTVKTHRQRLLRKLGVKNAAQLIAKSALLQIIL